MTRKKPEEKKLDALGARFARFKHATAALHNIWAVPTRFSQFDWATRFGGWPTHRSVVIHGPSNEGKTLFGLGVTGDFVEQGHFGHWGDAERTTTPKWIAELLGQHVLDSPRFYASRPETYEKFVDEVRDFHHAVRDARKHGEVPQTTTALTFLDSLRKLVPEDIMRKITAAGASGDKGSVDGMGGRAAQIRAAMNAAWMDELVPLIDDCGTSFATIARESEDPNADQWARKFGTDYRLQGGKAVVYDASLRIRIQRDSWIPLGTSEADKKVVIGERIKGTIFKTKIGGKEDRAAVFYFHTSNGRTSPYGFDRARDVVELALKIGVLTQDSARYRWPSRGGGSWNGRENMIRELRDAKDDLAMLETECRGKFADTSPEEEEGASE